LNEKVPQIQIENPNCLKNEMESGSVEEEELEDAIDVMFKVTLSKPSEGVKISSKNCCNVTLLQEDDDGINELEGEKMLEYFMQCKEPSWS